MSNYNTPLIKTTTQPPPYTYYQQPISTGSLMYPVQSPDIFVITQKKIERRNGIIICGAVVVLTIIIVLLLIFSSHK